MKKCYFVYLYAEHGENEVYMLQDKIGYEMFTNLKKARSYAYYWYRRIKDDMKNGDIAFDEKNTIAIDIESYDDADEEIDWETYSLVKDYLLQGGY